jgi:hypothetical protein
MRICASNVRCFGDSSSRRGGELDGGIGEEDGDELGKSNEVSFNLGALESIGRRQEGDWKISGSMCIEPGSVLGE